MARDAIARTLAVVGLGGVALIHLLDAHDTFIETPYKGWLVVALIGPPHPRRGQRDCGE